MIVGHRPLAHGWWSGSDHYMNDDVSDISPRPWLGLWSYSHDLALACADIR